ncbi:hypothetical protein [Ramlibacter rhizophilus]|uniref:hypothetical protein n=1 Tax=Ramlibacter rhizophilus TaxID=1781167 RepID=UPI0014325B1B|nr:hypothetical protein [Ramlibacter rhizophilus]
MPSRRLLRVAHEWLLGPGSSNPAPRSPYREGRFRPTAAIDFDPSHIRVGS